MTAEEIIKKLKKKFGDKILETELESVESRVLGAVVDAKSIAKICTFLKNEPDLRFTSLMCLSSVDPAEQDGEHLRIVYHLHSMEHKHKITLEVAVLKNNPVVPSVSAVWRTADWHEREAYDLMGIRFTGHPDFRRILCPDDWKGHPLRKDYIVEQFYNNVPIPYPEEDGKQND